MTDLIKYDAARKAIIEAATIDEVKNIKDKAEAMRLYAKQSQDYEMANKAAEIRLRAERRMGEMLKQQKEAGQMNKGTAGQLDGRDISGGTTVRPPEDEAPTLADVGISKSMSSRAQQVAAIPEDEFEERIEFNSTDGHELTGASIRKAVTVASLHTGDEESYTPSQYIESARKVMLAIDLDPASNDMAQETVKAAKYYTVNEDGLSQAWSGRVWMNPPYTARVINKFITKLVDHYMDGQVSDAIILTNNNTDTSWFHEAAKTCTAICFTAGRINFLKRDGSKSSPTNGQAFLYFGKSKARFKKEFSRYGVIVEVV